MSNLWHLTYYNGDLKQHNYKYLNKEGNLLWITKNSAFKFALVAELLIHWFLKYFLLGMSLIHQVLFTLIFFCFKGATKNCISRINCVWSSFCSIQVCRSLHSLPVLLKNTFFVFLCCLCFVTAMRFEPTTT